MKARIFSLTTSIFSLSLLFTACQKEKITATDYYTETTLHSDDQSRFSNEIDGAANDVNVALEGNSGFAGRSGDVQSFVCDATIAVDTISSTRTITITYNGSNCLGNRSRSGVILISMAQGVRWKNAGATLNVSFQNFKITRLGDNKSITINGTQTYTNVSGGLLINLPTLNTITHTITSSNMSVTFDNGQQRNWQVARQRVFSFNSGVVITTTGTHTEGTTTGVAEWGTNRFGNPFKTSITQPLIIRQDCNFRLVSGKVAHATNLFNATVTFGLDAAGAATTCPGANSYYLKIGWTGPSGIPRIVILPY